MRRFTLYVGLATALVASCSIREENFETPQQDDVVYYASFEQPAEEGTRVYVNKDYLLRWTADDRVSIFEKNTYNQQFRFTGATGDNVGGFKKVGGDDYHTGNSIPNVVSVYPYLETTTISESGVLAVNLPAEQHYAENTFGLGDNIMVSVSANNSLQYKNVGGYLMLKLYGDGISVSSITLRGNNGEKLSGKATVTMPQDGTPTVAMAQDATEEITLVCDSPVVLGTTAKESVDFWFVVPPVTFSKGFTITVAYTGGVSEKVTTKSVTIARNNLSKMSPVEIELSQPNNVIYYTSSDGTVVTPDEPGAFGANIVSNDYIDGQGVITFDGDITHVGDFAFSQTRLSSISLPNSVLGIGKLAFYECDGLVSINIPEGVTSIGQQAFDYCSSLISISFPKSVDSIGEWAFHDCGSLVGITVDPQNLVFDSRNNCNAIIETSTNTLVRGSINTIIPEDVINIGATAFSGCSELSQIIIPDNVKSIGKSAFSGTGLTSITIPDGITSIESNTFRACEKLVSVSLPDSVVNIDTYAFGQCTSLSSISIPHNVKSIGSHAFDRCTSLTSVSVPGSVDAVEDYVFSGCSSLISVSIENGVKSIGYAAFWDCSELVSIELPNSLTSIGDGAFVNCSRLDSITIPASVTSMGEFAFGWCTGLSSLSLSDGLSCIGEASFYSCSRLSTVTIPDSVTSIGESAFEECTNLANIIILSNLPPSGSQFMFKNTNNCPIYVPAGSVEAYKSAQYWSDYADRIFPIGSQADVINLSKNGTANCYLAPKNGKYSYIATVKGNSKETIEEPASARVLWETFNTSETPSIGDVVKNVKYSDGKILFETSNKEGNALIAVTDESGVILWSWHIWVTDSDIDALSQQYSTGAVLMDRNLGALSSEPGNVLSLGLLYQWGRKDPFIGSSEVLSDTNDSSNPEAASTNPHEQPIGCTKDTGTIEYSIQHPTTPIQCDGRDSYDWLYSPYGVSDDTRWTKEKTIYDPCPIGWQVPDESIWLDLFKGAYQYVSFIDNSLMDYQNRGVDLHKYTSIHCWFPFAGEINPNATQYLLTAGRGGSWWTYNSYQSAAGCLDIWYDANGLRIYPLLKAYKSDGYSVRCVKQ